jgi:hypothetical protein
MTEPRQLLETMTQEEFDHRFDRIEGVQPRPGVAYKPVVVEGLVLCLNCGDSWSNHTMSGACPGTADGTL